MSDFLLNLPDLFGAFDIDEEVEALKSRLYFLSLARHTDNSESAHAIALGRAIYERFSAILYQVSARRYPADSILKLGELLGVTPLTGTYAYGDVSLHLAPGTSLPVNYRIGSSTTGLIYRLLSAVSTIPGGVFRVPAIAMNTGPEYNIQDPGIIDSPVGADPLGPLATGTLISVSNVTAFSGGSGLETLENYRKRLPGAVQNDRILTLFQYEFEAIQSGVVVKAKAYRSLTPGIAAGEFNSTPGNITLVLIGAGGLPVSGAVTTLIYNQIIAKTSWRMQEANNGGQPRLHVVSGRTRVIGVTGILYAKKTANFVELARIAKERTIAFLDPVIGGQTGEGYTFGRAPRKTELIYLLESLVAEGVSYVDEDSLVLSGASAMAIDEFVTPPAPSSSLITYTILPTPEDL